MNYFIAAINVLIKYNLWFIFFFFICSRRLNGKESAFNLGNCREYKGVILIFFLYNELMEVFLR